MGHERQVGGPVFGEVLPVISLGNQLISLFNPPEKPEPVIPNIRQLAGGSSGLITAVQGRIDAAIAAGRAPSPADIRLVEFAHDFRTKQEAQFRFLQQNFPEEFTRFGVPVGSTAAQAIDFLFNLPRRLPVAATRAPLPAGVGGGVVLGGADPGFTRGPAHPPGSVPRAGAGGPTAGGFNPATFIKCLIASLLPSSQGGRMPFQISPGPQASSGGFDFGGFLQSGLNLVSNIFSKPQSPAQRFPELQQTGFPLLAAGSGLARSLFPSLAAGAVGGGAQGFIESLFASGGAAFIDPVPGSCRPKAHVKTNPCTGKGVWFVPRGRPLVFSGDMSACKRVDRVAKRLDKARPKRRHHHHPR